MNTLKHCTYRLSFSNGVSTLFQAIGFFHSTKMAEELIDRHYQTLRGDVSGITLESESADPHAWIYPFYEHPDAFTLMGEMATQIISNELGYIIESIISEEPTMFVFCVRREGEPLEDLRISRLLPCTFSSRKVKNREHDRWLYLGGLKDEWIQKYLVSKTE